MFVTADLQEIENDTKKIKVSPKVLMSLNNATTQSIQKMTHWNSQCSLPFNLNSAFLHEDYQAQSTIFLPECIYTKLLCCPENKHLKYILALMLTYYTKDLSKGITSLMLQNIL